MSRPEQPKLMEQVRDVMRRHHYSIHTERTYREWIRRYVKFHGMKSREDLTTTMIYTHVLQQGGEGVPSPLDDLAI